ncbi:MAG: type II secretion system protein N [Burkholderiales bacterium]|jgi:general secretion pathway protein C|uniref:type II secretion system protein N n=1 Tax=Limnohabitans sp. TaxID=1907725 RepID=UPI0037C1AAB1
MFQSPVSQFQQRRLDILTAVIWLVAVATAVFWVLAFPRAQEGGAQGAVPVTAASVGPVSDASAQSARVWGVATAAPQVSMGLSARFQLWGVVASASGQGSALISVDGLPPKAFRVEQVVSEGVALLNLGPRQASLGPQGGGVGTFTLSLQGQDQAL